MKPHPASELEIRALKPTHVKALRAFLQELEKSGEASRFHPHPFSLPYLRKLSGATQKNIYLIAIVRGKVLAYGMLRGWDDGYEVPSLGLAVHPDFRQQGLGRMMMLVLHTAARLRGASRIRLKVYRDNTGARALYRRLGYRFSRYSDEELLGFINLS